MKYYDYVNNHLFEKITDGMEYDYKFAMMCTALGVENNDGNGNFKDMFTFIKDLLMAYITYQREENGIKFHGLK